MKLLFSKNSVKFDCNTSAAPLCAQNSADFVTKICLTCLWLIHTLQACSFVHMCPWGRQDMPHSWGWQECHSQLLGKSELLSCHHSQALACHTHPSTLSVWQGLGRSAPSLARRLGASAWQQPQNPLSCLLCKTCECSMTKQQVWQVTCTVLRSPHLQCKVGGSATSKLLHDPVAAVCFCAPCGALLAYAMLALGTRNGESSYVMHSSVPVTASEGIN